MRKTKLIKTIKLTTPLLLCMLNTNVSNAKVSDNYINYHTDLIANIMTNNINLNNKLLKSVNGKTNNNVLENVNSGAYAYTTKVMYAKTNVNIRVKPNTNSKIVDMAHFGDKVKIINEKTKNKKWAKIEYKNNFRYICTDYLVKNKPKRKDVTSIKLNGLSDSQKQRAYTIARVCINEWDRYGVLPSVAIAQAMVESTLGKYCSGNNLWGIASGAISYDSLESGVYGYLKVINNGCYGSAPFTRDSSSQINKILSGGYCVPVGEYYENATWIIDHYGLERFDTLINY